MIEFDFAGASVEYVSWEGWRARVGIVALALLGPARCIAFARRFLKPLKIDRGLIVWSPNCLHLVGDWSVRWNLGAYWVFGIARAGSDAQLRCWQNGYLAVDVGAANRVD